MSSYVQIAQKDVQNVTLKTSVLLAMKMTDMSYKMMYVKKVVLILLLSCLLSLVLLSLLEQFLLSLSVSRRENLHLSKTITKSYDLDRKSVV